MALSLSIIADFFGHFSPFMKETDTRALFSICYRSTCKTEEKTKGKYSSRRRWWCKLGRRACIKCNECNRRERQAKWCSKEGIECDLWCREDSLGLHDFPINSPLVRESKTVLDFRKIEHVTVYRYCFLEIKSYEPVEMFHYLNRIKFLQLAHNESWQCTDIQCP